MGHSRSRCPPFLRLSALHSKPFSRENRALFRPRKLPATRSPPYDACCASASPPWPRTRPDRSIHATGSSSNDDVAGQRAGTRGSAATASKSGSKLSCCESGYPFLSQIPETKYCN
ncbi:uncharacterized protein LOC143357181 [Halictus rubicundus]|uniref:uncharacterized protein LOC143357181 n=1 Tax=Halictus rubicundus TaxID=77578 RepID=UPI004034FE37